MQSTVIISFAAILIISVLLSLLASGQKPTIHAFFWGDRRLHPALTTSLILTSSFSLNGLLYQAWLGYTIGWWALIIQAVWCSSFGFLAFNIHRFQEKLGEGTMHGIIANRLGPAAGRLASVASLIGFSILIGWEVVVGSTILGNVAGFDGSVAFWLPALLAILGAGYTAMGGLRGNAFVNAMQNLFKSGILLVAFFALVIVYGGDVVLSSPAGEKNFSQAWIALGGFALTANLAFSLFWQTVDMSNWQNLSATRVGKESSRLSILAAGLLVFLFPGLIGTLIGITLSGMQADLGVITEANILNIFVQTLESAPLLATALFAAFAAAMLSTIDGYALAAAQAATWDITNRKQVAALLPRGPDRTPTNEDTIVIFVARVFIFLVAGAGALGVGFLVKEGIVTVFDLVYLVVVAQMSLVGPIMICLLCSPGKTKSNVGWAAILVPLIGGFFSIIVGKTTSIVDAYVFAPVVTIALSLITAWLVRPSPKPPASRE